MYTVTVENFNSGIEFNASGSLAIYDSKFNNMSADALQVTNASAQVYVHNTAFVGNGEGVRVAGGSVTIADSSAEHNGNGFAAGLSTSTLTLVGDRVSYNGIGLVTSQGAVTTFTHCLIANNKYGDYDTFIGDTVLGTSPGTSVVGSAENGPLSTPTVLQ